MNIDVWGVAWKRKKGEKIPEFVTADDKVTRVIIGYPLFGNKKDAEEFIKKDSEMEVVKVKIRV